MLPSGVAAGHPATVEAGIEILEDGGSAADAAVAASLASCVAETVMTGLLGGGHAIHWDGSEAWLLDCFVDVPSGRGCAARGAAGAVRGGARPLRGRAGHLRGAGASCRPRRALAAFRPPAVAAGGRTGSPARAQRRADASRPGLLPGDAGVRLHHERRRKADLRARGASTRHRRRALPAGPRDCTRAGRRRGRGQHVSRFTRRGPARRRRDRCGSRTTWSATKRAGSRLRSFLMRGRAF